MLLHPATSLVALLSLAASALAAVRPYDGKGVNPNNPTWGSTGQSFAYFQFSTTAAYSPLAALPDLPSARLVSNTVAKAPGAPEPKEWILSKRALSDLTTYWGEFIAQDLTHITVEKKEPSVVPPFIAIPSNDTVVSNNGSIPFYPVDSTTYPQSSPLASVQLPNGTTVQVLRRYPTNVATSFLDASHIYGITKPGSDRVTGYKFIMPDLKLSNGRSAGFPVVTDPAGAGKYFSVPQNLPNRPMFDLGRYAGNTSPNSQTLHIMFMREHNRKADEIKSQNSDMSDSDVFELARTWVIALVQKITVFEYLPVIINKGLPVYTDFDPSVNPTVDGFFSTVSFRYGHSEIGSYVSQKAIPSANIPGANLSIGAAMFDTQYVRNNGISPFLMGMFTTTQQEPDVYVVNDMRNFLFNGNPIDLFANDIDRARDFGLPGYTKCLEIFGFNKPTTFNFAENATINRNLAAVYKNVDQVDAIIGGLAENRSDSHVGPLFAASILEQYIRLRNGDSFWYERPGVLSQKMLWDVGNRTFRDVAVTHIAAETGMSVSAVNKLVPMSVWVNAPTSNTLDIVNQPFVMVSNENYFAVGRMSSSSEITIEVTCNGLNGFCGIGFGTGMTDTSADIIIAMGSGNALVKPDVQEYQLTNPYQAPSARKTTPAFKNVVANVTKDGHIFFTFTRPLVVAGRRTINATEQSIMWSFHPTSLNSLSYHSSNNRNKLVYDFKSGTVLSSGTVGLTTVRMIHGALMMFAFLFLFPLGIWMKRYMTNNEKVGLQKATWSHIGIQASGLVVALAALGVVLSQHTPQLNPVIVAHASIGYVLISLVILQALFGLLFKFIMKIKYEVRSVLKTIHTYAGYFVIPISLANTILGITQYLPFGFPDDTDGESFTSTYYGFWVSWVTIVGIMVILYVVTEIIIFHSVRFAKFVGKSKSKSNKGLFDSLPNDIHTDEGSPYGSNGSGIAQPMPGMIANNVAMREPTRGNTLPGYSEQGNFGNGVPSRYGEQNGLVAVPKAAALVMVPQNEEQAGMVSRRRFTWKQLDDAIKAGEQLIVGAGRYVYDISSWVPSHPGGRAILYTVMGTDVTNDFFNELTTFDAGAFTAKEDNGGVALPASSAGYGEFRPDRAWIDKLVNDAGVDAQTNEKTPVRGTIKELSPNDDAYKHIATLKETFLTNEEWKALQKSRRTHQHGKTAFKKITSLMVGEIVQADGRPLNPLQGGEDRLAPFDPSEYRRYALVRKELLTSKNGKSTTPVYLCRFALLYPYTSRRDNEPEDDFSAGQCVEIQVGVETSSGGGEKKPEYISRYYTPISGNLRSFEVMIKVRPGGKLTPMFTKSDRVLIGVKQFKVRGPYGKPLNPQSVSLARPASQPLPPVPAYMGAPFNPSLHMLSPDHLRILAGLTPRTSCPISTPPSPTAHYDRWTRLIFISAGSGLAPYLQILRHHFLPAPAILYAYLPTTPTSRDQPSLEPGDSVLVASHTNDGWCYGHNLRTRATGYFPLGALVPLSGIREVTGTRFALINCVNEESSIFGEDIIRGAALATSAPNMTFSVVHVVSSPEASKEQPAQFPYDRSVVRGTKINSGVIGAIVRSVDSETPTGWENDAPAQIIVCGPAAFEGAVYTILVDELEIEHSRITVLPPDSA
ncbi:heme peroxidase [Cladochytrium replicatum]|nr:heme peroxidase [Cladochytrium replicatum]